MGWIHEFWVEQLPMFSDYGFIYVFLDFLSIYMLIELVIVFPLILFFGGSKNIWKD